MINTLKKLSPPFLKVLYHKLRFLQASIQFGTPQKELKLIGVTGSSGKSTTAFMIYHILKENGLRVGLISTVGAYIEDKEMDTGLHVTTPDAHDIPKFLKEMVDNNIEYVVIETSSHALAQGRLGNLKFLISVFTNITSDHLDWHKTWKRYAFAKAKLIDMTEKNGLVIINKDDRKSYRLLKSKVIKSERDYFDYSIKDLENVKSSLIQKFTIDNVKFNINLVGSYNISNALAAIDTCLFLNISLEDCSKALETFKTLPGHMEVLKESPYKIILDFAHNTDSLEKSLKEIRQLATGRIISLFGSAGLRDFKKRYDMGLVAAKLSDIVIVVPEDPRTEKLVDINNEIVRGTTDGGLKSVKRFNTHKEYLEEYRNYINKEGVFVFDYEEVQARVDGIELGIKLLKDNDILITQGKGHEQSLCFGEIEYPYDEKSVILNLLKTTT